MAGLTVENFITPAVGVCALLALIRGIVGRSGGGPRQLLAGPDPIPLLRPAAALDRRRADPRLPRRRADPRRRRRREDARGRRAGSRVRPGRLAGRDQAARHQRRRLLQRQLGNAVRERERAHQLRRAALDRPDPGGAHLHLRPLVGRQRQGWAIFAAMLAIYVALSP